MTQISIRGLLDQAHDLHAAISTALETVQNNNGPIQPLEWHELAAAAQAAALTANLLDHMIRRADEPVPYIPAALASCGHLANKDGEHDCAWWPERAPLEALDLDLPF